MLTHWSEFYKLTDALPSDSYAVYTNLDVE